MENKFEEDNIPHECEDETYIKGKERFCSVCGTPLPRIVEHGYEVKVSNYGGKHGREVACRTGDKKENSWMGK